MLVKTVEQHPLQIEVLTDCTSFTDVLCREISAHATPVAIHVHPTPDLRRPTSGGMADLVVAEDPDTADLRDALAGWLNDSHPHVPYVILLPEAREGEVDAWLRRGASDYVLMEHPARVRSVVASALQHHQTELLLREQSMVMEKIALGASLPTILNELTGMVERICPDMACSILLLSPDQRHLLHGSASSLPDAYNQAIHGVAIGPAVGSCGTAAYYKKQVIVEDIGTDPLWADYRDLASDHGLRACWSTPIFDTEKKVLGTLAMYYNEVRRPEPFHLRLIEVATHAAQIAINRSRTEQRLLDTTRGLQAVVEAADELLHCTTLDQLYRRCVELARERLGLERCALFLRVGDELQATYGTDDKGQTTVEFQSKEPLTNRYPDTNSADFPRWITQEQPYCYNDPNGETVRLGGAVGWVASTPLYGSNHKLYGIFTNDNALTRTPLSRVQQEVVSVYCSLAATILESMARDEERQQSQRRFEQLARAIHEVFWTSNRDGTEFQYASPAFESIWDCSTEALYADASLWMQRIHPEDRDRVRRAQRSLDRLGYDLEYRLKLPDGSQRWVRDQAYPVFDEMDEIYRISGIAEDITVRKQTEENEKALQAKLVRAERMESLGLLAGGVAHDLNNILGPIVGYPELMLMDLPDDDPMRDSVVAIRDSARRAADVIQDLLILARRGIKQQSATCLVDAMDEFFESAVFRDIQKRFPNMRLVQDRSPERYVVNSSAPHLSQVIMNLVINAGEAMPNGGNLWVRSGFVTVDHAMGRDRQILPGDYVRLEVQDEGDGIEEADIEKLFDPFYTKKQMGRSGSGLGLSIVYGVVQDANGFVEVHSRPGEGTLFSIYFPPGTQPVKPPAQSKALHQGRETILVVDDVPEQRKLAARILDKLGYTVFEVSDGRAAVAWLEENSADLVILDMLLAEGFDGLDTFREIRKRHPNLHCILATGFAETDRVKEAQRLGAGTCILKPYSMNQLSSAIRKALHP